MSAKPSRSATRKLYVREPAPTGALRPISELALVELMVGSRTIDGVHVPAGRVGTIVFVYGEGEAYEVEFAEPVGTLVTVPAEHVREVEPVAGERLADRMRSLGQIADREVRTRLG